MKDKRKTKEQLINELAELRQRITELESPETERKRAEEALQQERDRAQKYLDIAGVMFVAINAKGEVTLINQKGSEILGYEQEEIIGKNWFDSFLPVSIKDQTKTVFHRLMASEIEMVEYHENPVLTKGGEERMIAWHNTILKDDEGNIIGTLSSGEDITERKRAEEALQESEERFRDLVEHSHDLICNHDLDGRILSVNQRAAKLLGYDQSVLLKTNIRDILVPEVRDKFDTYLATIERDGFSSGLMLVQTSTGERRIWEYDNILRTEGVAAPIVRGMAHDITERKRAEEVLQESEIRFRSIFNQTFQFAGIVALDGTLTAANYASLDFIGVREADVIGRPFWNTPWWDHSKELQEWLRDGISRAAQGEIIRREITHVSRHGELHYFDFSLKPVVDEGGKVLYLIPESRNITERKRAEEALQESEARHRLHFENVSDIIYSIDHELKLIDISPSVESMLGYKPEELIGRPFQDLNILAPAYLEQAFSDAMRVLGGERIPSAVYQFIARDGTRKWGEVSGAPLVRDGQVVALVSVARDIAERKRAEQLLQALNAAALAMEQALTLEGIFAAVAEEFKKLNFSCMVFLTDESQSRLFTTYMSYESRVIKAVEKLVGLKQKDFSFPIETVDLYREVVWEGKTIFTENSEEVLRQLLPKSAKRFAGQMMRMLKVPKAVTAALIMEDKVIGVLSVQSDDLTEADMPAITAFAHQMAAAWRKAQLMEDLQDNLEELKQTQAQLLQLQKMEALGQLAAGIAHDFNNLLTPMGGFADLLLGKAAEGSKEREYLHQIKVAAERAAALTNQLRLFTRQARGERHPVQLNNVVEETRDLLERSIPKEITIELSLESELWMVEADPSQLSQVLVNLCVNAWDAMAGGGTLTLETCNVTLDEEYARMVLEARPGRYVRLSVSDIGCGMSPEVQARLFEPFFTTKGMGEGTGLGLAMVYGIVKGHGGFIQVYSQEGQGSTFHVYLPAREGAVEEREVEELTWLTGTETILVVDDEDGIRTLGRAVLEGCGYTVLMAEDGLQALEVYQGHRGEIALVVLDVIMPRMSGLECLRRLRELDPQVKVLISTGYTAKGLAQELVAEGALGVVEKPFRVQDFATTVRTAIDGP